jgi:valyl-tRNA synthetase
MSLEDRKRFDPREVEPRISQAWLASGLFHPEPEGDPLDNFSVAIPPPNVTGALHMGHALNGSVQDCLTRAARQRGRRAKWILGTDHAGIATQKQVEKLLVSEGTSREEIGREAFVERTWAWREQYGGTIVDQFKRLGASCDYEQERFTLDDGYHRAVLEVFTRLYDKGLIYRDRYLVNWDPGSRSAISDLEVEEREVDDVLYSVAYPLADGSGEEVVVATVRPETMLADTAVAVHPDDDRYRHLIGKRVQLPLTDRELPVIADEYVKMDFGTGCLKITPGHDPNDFEIGRRHGLEQLSVIGEDGRMTAEAGEFAGLPVLEARERIVGALGSAVRGREPYRHTVPFSHRSGERIEPLISLQWFMAMDELAKPAIAAVQDGRLRIHPESQARRYVEWLQNIRPWCISRQLWWGHQIPVWYRGDNEIHVGTSPPEGDGWTRDADVLDTWFSSALWPFATLGWPQSTPELRAFYPTDVLSTARDILFLWVARMVMMGLEFTGEVPFADVYCHSVIQAPDGRRMSKSLGTGIDPLDEIDAHGADAVRFGLLAMSSTQDVRYSSEKVQQGQRLANKLFNASRFVLLNVGSDVEAAPRPTTLEDRWILARLAVARAQIAAHLDGFDFAKAAFALYDFVYGELCDWYLEMVKGRPYDEDLSATLLHVLRETLALAHPIIPFVTEELWAHVPGTEGLLAAHHATSAAGAPPDEAAQAGGQAVIGIVQALRRWREDAGVPPREVLRVRLRDEQDRAQDLGLLVQRLARVELCADDGEPSAVVAWEQVQVEVLPYAGLDPEEVARERAAARGRLQAEIARAEAKLANEGFVAKAPEAVVGAERDKLERLRAELGELEAA